MMQAFRSWMSGPWLEAVRNTRSLTLALWAGLALLTVMLIVLTRTRWGQARPLSKCVALSVLAHVLFAAYAYGTRLFMEMPPGPAEQVVHLTVLETATIEAPEPATTEETAPWKDVADADVIAAAEMPEAERVSTAVGEAPEAVEATMPEAPKFQIGADVQGIARREPVAGAGDLPTQPLPEVPESHVQDSLVEAAPIDIPRPEPAPVVRPTADGPTVPDAPERAVSETLADAGADELAEPVETPRIDPLINKLAEQAMETTRPEAVAAQIDDVQTTVSRQDQGAPAAPAAPATARPAPQWAPAVAAGAETAPAPRRLGDGQPMPEMYRARVPDLRLTIAQQYGGDRHTEASVEAALAWLAVRQEADGRWSAARHGGGREREAILGHARVGSGAKADTAMTGIAVLAYLAAGNTHYEGEYRLNVQRGLEFLIGVQQSDGCLAGDASLFARMYCHGMASLAVSEAYAMTGDQRLQRFVERAARYTAVAQDPYSGSWRYRPGDRKGDMSQFGWQVMALKSAEMAGVTLHTNTQAGMLRFLNSSKAGPHGGLAAYRPGEKTTPTMTAEALSCRFFLRTKPSFAQRREATELLLRNLPDARQANYYYWYYGTLAMFQDQGDGWQKWNEALKRELVRRQVRGGDHAGSWPPDSLFGGYGGRVYTTAMATLCLEVYYRYLPIYEPQRMANR